MVLPSSSVTFSINVNISHKFPQIDNGDNVIWLKGQS